MNTLFEFETVTLLSAMLVALRLGVLFYLTPFDAFGRVPRRIIVFFTIGMSLVMVNSFDALLTADQLTVEQLVLAGLFELCNGFVMVLGVYVAFSAFLIAGQLIDAQIGFMAAAVLNPATNTQEPITGVVLQLLAGVLFFTLGMHRLFFEGIVISFQLVPVGEIIKVGDIGVLVAGFGTMFVYGLMLAAPVLVTLLMLDVGIGMMSRTMPQMNIYFVTLPLKIGVGLIILVMSLRYVAPLFTEIFSEIFRYWGVLLA